MEKANLAQNEFKVLLYAVVCCHLLINLYVVSTQLQHPAMPYNITKYVVLYEYISMTFDLVYSISGSFDGEEYEDECIKQNYKDAPS